MPKLYKLINKATTTSVTNNAFVEVVRHCLIKAERIEGRDNYLYKRIIGEMNCRYSAIHSSCQQDTHFNAYIKQLILIISRYEKICYLEKGLNAMFYDKTITSESKTLNFTVNIDNNFTESSWNPMNSKLIIDLPSLLSSLKKGDLKSEEGECRMKVFC